MYKLYSLPGAVTASAPTPRAQQHQTFQLKACSLSHSLMHLRYVRATPAHTAVLKLVHLQHLRQLIQLLCRHQQGWTPPVPRYTLTHGNLTGPAGGTNGLSCAAQASTTSHVHNTVPQGSWLSPPPPFEGEGQ